MRARPNDTLDDPVRRCILTGDRAPRDSLIRLAFSPDGQVLPDVRARAPGRGAWIGVDRPALEAAITKGRMAGALTRAFRDGPVTVTPELPEMIEGALMRSVLDRLGLEARSGTVVMGAERIEAAARGGGIHLLLHANDAGEDGRRRLDQAWRVGMEREGNGMAGPVLPLSREALGAALGRHNVVHVGIASAASAARLSADIGRWLHFIGKAQAVEPCETGGERASAVSIPAGGVAADLPGKVHEDIS